MEKCSLLISNFKKMSSYNLNNTKSKKILNVNNNTNDNNKNDKKYEDMFLLLIN